jgi:outer membrane protein assembly factor BamE
MISSARPGKARGAIVLAGLAAAAVMATGCASRLQPAADRVADALTPYRIEIVQGNAVTREQVALVRPGMTRLQVRDVLGTAMLSDPFKADRWDYVFTIRRPGTPEQRRHVVAHFEGDVLQRLDAPADLPSENEFVASIDPARRAPAPRRALELTEAERAALPAPAARPPAAAAEAPAAGPPRAYPPLER